MPSFSPCFTFEILPSHNVIRLPRCPLFHRCQTPKLSLRFASTLALRCFQKLLSGFPTNSCMSLLPGKSHWPVTDRRAVLHTLARHCTALVIWTEYCQYGLNVTTGIIT